MASLYKMYLHSKVNGYDFKFVSMPPGYRPVDETPYDPEEMRRMFRIGYKMGLEKTHWQTVPPDL